MCGPTEKECLAILKGSLANAYQFLDPGQFRDPAVQDSLIGGSGYVC